MQVMQSLSRVLQLETTHAGACDLPLSGESARALSVRLAQVFRTEHISMRSVTRLCGCLPSLMAVKSFQVTK